MLSISFYNLWVFIWDFNAQRCINARWQIVQICGFSPVCIILWCFKLWIKNVFINTNNYKNYFKKIYTYFRCPKRYWTQITSKWTFSTVDSFMYNKLTKIKINYIFFRILKFLRNKNYLIVLNDFLQLSHEYGLRPEWVLEWVDNSPEVENIFPQIEQL